LICPTHHFFRKSLFQVLCALRLEMLENASSRASFLLRQNTSKSEIFSFVGRKEVAARGGWAAQST
jgi:hypothetical protein